VVDALGLFAQLIGAQLALEDRVEQADTALLDANAKLQLRDQFVASSVTTCATPSGPS